MRTAVAVLVAAALVAAVRGAIVRDDAIEYAANDEQLAFWSKTSHAGTPALITFPADVTVEQALPRVAQYLLGPSGGACRFVHASTGVLIADTRAAAGGHLRVRAFLDAATPEPPKGLIDVQPGSVSLHCDDARGFHSVKRAITRFVPPTPPPPSRPKWVGSSQYPNTNADLVGDTLTGLLHWAVEFVAVHWGEVHPFNVWPATASGRFDLDTGAPISVHTKGAAAFADADTTGAADTQTRLALTADWGSGTEESDYVSQLLVKDYAPHWTVHIGDVYYLGAKEDFDSNVFGIAPAGVAHGVTWPHGSLGSFGLMGNHEMYSRGVAYFDHFLPTLGARNASGQLAGQAASYFSLENAYWRVVCLDTGYNTYSILFENNDNPQPEPVIEWLQNEVKIGDPTDTRGIIFFSHHQPLTAFDKEDKYTATPTQLQSLLPPNRTVLWLFGHEHRVSFYDLNSGLDGIDISVYARCCGNGGFPTSIAPIPGRAAATHLRAYDDRVYETYDGFWKAQIGYQGFQHLNFTGPTLTIDYKSLAVNADGTPNPNASDLLVSEAWTTDAKGNVQLNSFNVVNPNITIVNP